MASTLVGNPLFSTSLWLEGSSLFSGVEVVSGPIDLKSLASSPFHSQFPQFPLPSYNHPKCRPSQPLPEANPKPTVTGILTPPDSLISQPIAPVIDYQQVYYTTVIVRSTKNKTVLPLNVNIGAIRARTSEDDLTWQHAVDHTAEQLSDIWLNFVTSRPPGIPCHTTAAQPNFALGASRSWTLDQQKSEMARAGLDSSVLSPFLPEPESDHPHAFPPTDSGGLDPHSEEYFNKLVQTLELDSPTYSHVDPWIMQEFKELLRKYPEAFYLPGSQLGTMKGFYHNIDTGQAPPVYRLPYRKSPAELCAIRNELQKMISQGIVKPSHSPCGAPCILVRKPPGKGIPQPLRFVVNYRGLNAVTSGDGYPISSVSNILDALSGAKIFAKLDLASGYWQVLVNPAHTHKTAFATHVGLYEFLRMPYGLKTAPHTFQHVLNSVFSDYLYQWLIIYIDDCIIWSSNQSEALSQYGKVVERAVQYGLQFKPTKCFFFSENLEILGHRITPESRFPTQKGTEAISAMPRLHVSSVKRFLGIVGYFRDYVKNMSTRTKHLRALLKKGTPFLWTSAHEAEFNDLKDALTSPDTMLFHPDCYAPFAVHTDASKHGCGAMLSQWHRGKLHPVKFSSRSFNPTESRSPTTHQELYAVKWALEQNRPHLLGRPVKVITDHANLKFLTSISPHQSKLACWAISMAEFDFTLEHRPGKEHVVPDTLSRAPLLEPSTTGDNLVVFPAPVAAFFVTTLGYDIPFLNSSLISEVFNDTFQCITLSCPLPNFIATTHSKSKLKPSNPPSDGLPLTPPPSQVDNPPLVTPKWSASLETLHPLSISRTNFAQRQRDDPWLWPLFHYLLSNQDSATLTKFPKKVSSWVKTIATNCQVTDGLIMYADKLMDNPGHYRIFVPSDPQLQRHFLHAYHDSPMGMHRDRNATYNALSRDFYWRNLSKHVRNWVRRCQHCIRFKSLQPAHGPMQVRLYQHPFHTLGVDYVGELPVSPNGNGF